jgi:hypothetical protein
MAAAELTGASGHPCHGRLPRAVLGVYLALWAITITGAALTSTAARGQVREVMRLGLAASANPPPSLAHVLELVVHNLPICGWPLLLASLRLRDGSPWRTVADVVVAASVLVNALPVAAALGAYGWALVPYVPQLPLEWAALAVGYGCWIVEREQGRPVSKRLKLLGVLSVVLLAAGALETYAVPHR